MKKATILLVVWAMLPVAGAAAEATEYFRSYKIITGETEISHDLGGAELRQYDDGKLREISAKVTLDFKLGMSGPLEGKLVAFRKWSILEKGSDVWRGEPERVAVWTMNELAGLTQTSGARLVVKDDFRADLQETEAGTLQPKSRRAFALEYQFFNVKKDGQLDGISVMGVVLGEDESPSVSGAFCGSISSYNARFWMHGDEEERLDCNWLKEQSWYSMLVPNLGVEQSLPSGKADKKP